MLFRTSVRMLMVLTMTYLFENTSSDREQAINYSSIEESYHRCLALLSGDPWSSSASSER